MKQLTAYTIHRNSRPPAIHLVDNVNAARTFCGRIIDPATWYYGKTINGRFCRACEHSWRLRHTTGEQEIR